MQVYPGNGLHYALFCVNSTVYAVAGSLLLCRCTGSRSTCRVALRTRICRGEGSVELRTPRGWCIPMYTYSYIRMHTWYHRDTFCICVTKPFKKVTPSVLWLMVFVCMFNPLIMGSDGKVVNTVPRDLKKVYAVSSTPVRKYFTSGIVSDYHMSWAFMCSVWHARGTYRVRAHALKKSKVRLSVQINNPVYRLRKIRFEFMLLYVILVRLYERCEQYVAVYNRYALNYKCCVCSTCYLLLHIERK